MSSGAHNLSLLVFCQSCDHRSCGGSGKPDCTGLMTCALSGEDTMWHAEHDSCPINRRANAAACVECGMIHDGGCARRRVIEAIPRSAWPAAITAIATCRNDTDRGAGDTAERLVARMPSFVVEIGKSIKMWWTNSTTCNCQQDRDAMNAAYPYRPAEE